MIDVKELRINNKIYLELNLQPGLDVHTVRGDDIADISNGKITIHSLKPIPLTEDILLKCGFEWENDANRHLQIMIGRKRFMYFYCESGAILECQLYHETGRAEEYYSMRTSKPKYLHQLQNLYFALTGLELVVNL